MRGRRSRSPALHAAGRPRHQRRPVREQGPRLRRGRPASDRPSLPVDLVRIDSIYNPVRRANFTVAETRVGQRTDYDRLTLTVETNGTITPEEAVATPPRWRRRTSSTSWTSARTRRRRGGSGDRQRRRRQRLAQRLKTPIDDLELSVRSVNSLKNSNIRTLGDLVADGEPDLLGQELRQEVAPGDRRSARARGLNFGMRFEEADGDLRVPIRARRPPAAAAPPTEEASNAAPQRAGSSRRTASRSARCCATWRPA